MRTLMKMAIRLQVKHSPYTICNLLMCHAVILQQEKSLRKKQAHINEMLPQNKQLGFHREKKKKKRKE